MRTTTISLRLLFKIGFLLDLCFNLFDAKFCRYEKTHVLHEFFLLQSYFILGVFMFKKDRPVELA